jgi:uncharacterized protein involved in exopolysaccharide biosynthesis
VAQAADDHRRDDLSFAELVAVLYRRRWLLLAGLLLGGAGGTGLILAVPPVFTAQTLILLAPQAGGAGPSTAGAGISGGTALDGGVVDSQAQILASRSLAREAIDRLGLADDPELRGGEPGPLGGLLGRLVPALATEASSAVSPSLATGDAVGRFLERLTVRREGKSYAIAVVYRSAEPGRGARSRTPWPNSTSPPRRSGSRRRRAGPAVGWRSSGISCAASWSARRRNSRRSAAGTAGSAAAGRSPSSATRSRT